jgi:hypothetical protein
MKWVARLVYYVCAVVLGGLFAAGNYYPYLAHGTPRGPEWRGFFISWGYAVVLALFPLLLCGFLLRLAARRLGLMRAWQWLACGAVIFPAIVLAFGAAGIWIQSSTMQMSWKTALFAPLAGCWFVVQRPLWLLLPPGLLTALALCAVHRAFAPER